MFRDVTHTSLSEQLNRAFTFVSRYGSVNEPSKKRTPNKSRASDR